MISAFEGRVGDVPVRLPLGLDLATPLRCFDLLLAERGFLGLLDAGGIGIAGAAINFVISFSSDG